MGQGREEDTLAVGIVSASVDGSRKIGRCIDRSYPVGKRGWVNEEREVHWP